jgi:SAM-dependent methyltransferase
MNEQNSGCCGPQSDCCGSESIPSHAEHDSHRQGVREAYAKVAQAETNGDCCGVESSCCGVSDDAAINTLISTRLGYSEEDLLKAPSGADMGLGCGNPKAIAALQPGEVVVDLGAGGGFDCFLAAHEVGADGRVIGIDMTPDMLSKARANAEKGRFSNVEFRLGEIEYLPVANDTADVIISNCVINLSPDKAQVFRDAFRILKAGGRLAISDVVATVELPEEMRNDEQLIAGCMGNASLIEELEGYMREAGFVDICIEPKDESREFIRDWAPGRGVEDYVVSATIEAVKPACGCAGGVC